MPNAVVYVTIKPMPALNTDYKTKLPTPAAQNRFKAGLLALPGWQWQAKTEQYCQYRLEGSLGSQFLRAKQYTNGTLYLQASDGQALQQALTLLGIETEQTSSEQASSGTGNFGINASQPYLGTDESGKGDYFGPLVAAGVVVSPQTATQLKALGVADSKTLTDSKMQTLAGQIAQIVGLENIAFVVLLPERYNVRYAQLKAQGQHLNHLMGQMHARVIETLLGKSPLMAQQLTQNQSWQGITDRFGPERYVLDPLPPTLRQQGRLIQVPRAEADVAVAAASIVARVQFIKAVAQLGEQAGVNLPLGAGPNVLKTARGLVQSRGPGVLQNLAKLHFKTTQQVVG